MSQDNDYDVLITRSTGNVYDDLGLKQDTKDTLKNAIARQICILIKEKGLTQKEVAGILNTDQAKVSNVVRGRLSGFSVDRLVNFLVCLGYNIDIHLHKSKSDVHGTVTVHPPLSAYG